MHTHACAVCMCAAMHTMLASYAGVELWEAHGRLGTRNLTTGSRMEPLTLIYTQHC